MSESYLRRNDVGYPKQPNPRYIYGVKIFENVDLAALQTEVNLYLLDIPDTTDLWAPHVVDTQLMTYTSIIGTPTITFVMKITFYLTGTISANVAPIG
jgi:hypothetical protein